MNRADRRQWWRRNHKRINMTWDEYNSQFEKQKPFINYNKKK